MVKTHKNDGRKIDVNFLVRQRVFTTDYIEFLSCPTPDATKSS